MFVQSQHVTYPRQHTPRINPLYCSTVPLRQSSPSLSLPAPPRPSSVPPQSLLSPSSVPPQSLLSPSPPLPSPLFPQGPPPHLVTLAVPRALVGAGLLHHLRARQPQKTVQPAAMRASCERVWQRSVRMCVCVAGSRMTDRRLLLPPSLPPCPPRPPTPTPPPRFIDCNCVASACAPLV